MTTLNTKKTTTTKTPCCLLEGSVTKVAILTKTKKLTIHKGIRLVVTQSSVFDMKYLYIYTDPILRIVDIYAYTMNRYYSLINLCLHVLNELIFTLVLSAKTVLWLPLSQICPRSRFWKSVSISSFLFAKIDFKRFWKKNR